MTDKQFQRLLDLTAKSARCHFNRCLDMNTVFIQRYGQTYSEVDADGIIDVLNYHGGHITVEECDQEMSDCGWPRIVGTGGRHDE